MILALEQILNGAQLGLMLFLLAAGLTLVFGIMNLVNLAQGSLYMIGAYFAAAFNDSQFTDCNCMNVYISTTEPGRVDVVRYDRDTLVEAYKDFLCLTRLWRSQNSYDPRSL